MNNIKCDKCFQSFYCILHDTYGFNYCNDCICKICLEKPSSTGFIIRNNKKYFFHIKYSLQICDNCFIYKKKKQLKLLKLYGYNLNLSHDIENLLSEFLFHHILLNVLQT